LLFDLHTVVSELSPADEHILSLANSRNSRETANDYHHCQRRPKFKHLSSAKYIACKFIIVVAGRPYGLSE
jgi:hypothetical protein